MTPLLLLVHVEGQFRQFFKPMLVQRLVKAVKNYDSIHFTSEMDDENGVPIPEIRPYLQTQITWGWGDFPDMFGEKDEEKQWVIPSPSPHEWTWVPPELRLLKGISRPVLLGGGCDGECLLNMETCLRFLDIKYRKVEGLVYNA